MSDVKFQKDNISYQTFKSRTILGEPATPKIIGFVLKKGWAKSEKQAGSILLLLCGLCILVAIIITFWSIRSSSPNVDRVLFDKIMQR